MRPGEEPENARVTLKTLTYTSEAKVGLDADALERIHASAMTLNALDGVTGLLVFNGACFLQTVEGAPEAIDDLVDRLRQDPRHFDFLVRDDRAVESRSFPDWSMALVRVSRGRFEAREDIERALPATATDATRAILARMADLIST